jgi:ribonuclease HI
LNNSPKNSFALFTDVSLNPQQKFGFGGYLLIPCLSLQTSPDEIKRAEISAQVRLREFTETSSTKLEIQTVLWALEDYRADKGAEPGRLQIYTDSQCVAGLLGRRAGLEKSAFVARRSGKILENAPLYCSFYADYDELEFELIKVVGHSCAASHNTIERIFSYVDKEVRRALKSHPKTKNSTVVEILGLE